MPRPGFYSDSKYFDRMRDDGAMMMDPEPIRTRCAMIHLRLCFGFDARRIAESIGKIQQPRGASGLILMMWSFKLARRSASQIHEPKMKVDPVEKIMLSRSVELSDANSSKAPTWRASCQCLMTGNPSWGYPGRCSEGFGVR